MISNLIKAIGSLILMAALFPLVWPGVSQFLTEHGIPAQTIVAAIQHVILIAWQALLQLIERLAH